LIEASNDELESARQTYLDWIETHDMQLADQLIAAAVLGDRTDANRIAADIDARADAHLIAASAINSDKEYDSTTNKLVKGCFRQLTARSCHWAILELNGRE